MKLYSNIIKKNACPLPFVKVIISIIENKMNKNYVEFDFKMGTVFVIFSFF